MVSLLEETGRKLREIWALRLPEQLCGAVGRKESAALAEGSLCPTGYKRVLLNGPRVFVIGARGCEDGKGHTGLLGPQTKANVESFMCVCICVSKMRDKLGVWD